VKIWKAYITRNQLWAKPRLTFEPGGGVPSGLLDVCWMFARSCKRGITGRSSIHDCSSPYQHTFVPVPSTLSAEKH